MTWWELWSGGGGRVVGRKAVREALLEGVLFELSPERDSVFPGSVRQE